MVLPLPLVLRKVFEVDTLGPDLDGTRRKSLVLKEHVAQSIRKTGLGALGLARAGWFCDAGFGVAPSVYYMGRVKRFSCLEVGQVPFVRHPTATRRFGAPRLNECIGDLSSTELVTDHFWFADDPEVTDEKRVSSTDRSRQSESAGHARERPRF
jgi:hypothetical protein